MERSRLVNKRIVIKNPNWEFSMDGDVVQQEVEDDINKMMDELYSALRIDELLSKGEDSKRWIISPFEWEELHEWVLEVELEEILIDAKIRFE